MLLFIVCHNIPVYDGFIYVLIIVNSFMENATDLFDGMKQNPASTFAHSIEPVWNCIDGCGVRNSPSVRTGLVSACPSAIRAWHCLSLLGMYTSVICFDTVYKSKKTLPGDISLMTYRGHCVLNTLVRCRFSPAFTTGQRYIYCGCATGSVVSESSLSI